MKPMTLRLPDDLYDRLKIEATANGRSLHRHIIYRLYNVASPLEGDTVVIPSAIGGPAPDTSVVSPSTKPRRWASGKALKVSPTFDPTPHGVDVCTCGPGERAKGKHNKYCPLRGK